MTFTDLEKIPFVSEDSNDAPVVIAGPCSAESEQQVLETARQLASAGVRIFRAGAWKPRTRPGSFEGMGEKALPWLMAVKQHTGLEPMIEIANPRHLEEALLAGIRMFWIGARTSANPFAVQEIADRISSLPENLKKDISIFVKNPINPDIDLWIGSLERIYKAGVRRLGVIHRGFSSYGKSDFRNDPEWRIPIELKHRYPNLTLLCDPSHIGGKSELVKSISQQALDMKFDGLIIEAHICPEVAMSDARQQVTPAALKEIIDSLVKKKDSGFDSELKALRDRIDSLDRQLLNILSERMEISREIGDFKHRHNLSVVQPARYDQLVGKCVAYGEELGLSSRFTRNILAAIHEESVRQQTES